MQEFLLELEFINTPGKTLKEAKKMTAKECRDLKSKKNGNPLVIGSIVKLGIQSEEHKKNFGELVKSTVFPALSISLTAAKKHEDDKSYAIDKKLQQLLLFGDSEPDEEFENIDFSEER